MGTVDDYLDGLDPDDRAARAHEEEADDAERRAHPRGGGGPAQGEGGLLLRSLNFFY